MLNGCPTCLSLRSLQEPIFTTQILDLINPTVTTTSLYATVHNVTCSWLNTDPGNFAWVIFKLYCNKKLFSVMTVFFRS